MLRCFGRVVLLLLKNAENYGLGELIAAACSTASQPATDNASVVERIALIGDNQRQELR